jgi:hypothetical protein
MPMADSDEEFGRPTRTFIYGPDKTKKTWWAARAAEAGYNVILIDGDDGSSIVRQLPPEAKKKILIVDVVNTKDRGVFARFIAGLMRPGNAFVWDEQGKVSITPSTKRDPNKSYVFFDLSKLTMNDVLVIDSWTALAASAMIEWAAENNVDLAAVEKEGDMFSLLNYQSRFLDYTLNQIKTFPCHVIVIGHETVYEKWQGKGQERKMVEQRTQPFSSTGPHAKKIGAHFSNMLRFSKLSDLAFRIDAGGDASTAGGSRQLAPKKYDWKEITPQTIFAAVGGKSTGEECKGAVFIPKGSEQNLPSIAKSSAIPQASVTVPAPSPVVNAGESGSKISLLKKKQS